MTQKMISFEIDKKLKLLLERSLTVKRDKARLASLGLPHAGDWLNVIPSPVLGLHVRPQEFRYSVLYRLGAPIFTTDGACPACKKDSDKFGDHALVCGSHGERIARHNQLRDAIYSVAASSNLAPRKEESDLLPLTNAKPADVLTGLEAGTLLLMSPWSAPSLLTGWNPPSPPLATPSPWHLTTSVGTTWSPVRGRV